MPLFAVFAKPEGSGDIPLQNVPGQMTLFYGTYANEQAAVSAAADVLRLPSGAYLWAMPASAFTRYVAGNTRTGSPG